MNKLHAQKLINTAQRTIEIINLLMQGKTDSEIIKELADFQVERSLVRYYRTRLAQKY